MNYDNCGAAMYELLAKLFPICRSITGEGLRESLRILQSEVPLVMQEVPTGTKVLDWTVPREWNIRDAFILDEGGRKVADYKQNNLHVVGYSVPVNKTMPLDELQKHLHSLERQPDAIPYVTSYYQDRWGFCLSHRQRTQLRKGLYRVVIDSDLKDGSLTYGELIIPGATEQEVFLSTYVCHPSMANNELSGPVVTTKLAAWIAGKPRRFTYRIIFVPETIGALAYLSRHLETMKRNVVAGFTVTCVGDDRAYSYIPSRLGSTLADRAAVNVLGHRHPSFVRYSYLDRGSDERQYCSPGVDLPVASITRSKYGAYPEYHTSLDDLKLVSAEGLQGSFDVYRDCVELLEENQVYRSTCLGEPQLSKRGLYHAESVRDILNFLAYADGTRDLIGISDCTRVPPWRLYPIARQLEAEGLIVGDR